MQRNNMHEFMKPASGLDTKESFLASFIFIIIVCIN